VEASIRWPGAIAGKKAVENNAGGDLSEFVKAAEELRRK